MYKVSAKSERVNWGTYLKFVILAQNDPICVCMYNRDSNHARLNCHGKAWNYKEKGHKD